MKYMKCDIALFMLLSTVICQLLYAVNAVMGFVFVIAVSFIVLYVFKGTYISKIILLIFFSLPVSYISVLGDGISHMLSWYSLYTVILTGMLICRRDVRLNRGFLILLGLIFCILCGSNGSSIQGLIKVFQIYLTLIPCFLFYSASKNIKLYDYEYYADAFLGLVSGTSLIPMIQDILLNKFNIGICHYTKFANRITFDAWFAGYSVLSVFLGIGITIGVIKIYKKFSWKNLFACVVCLLGIVSNTSRTGLVAAICVVALVLLKNIDIRHMKRFMLVIIAAMPMAMILGIKLFLMKRNVSLLSENGRLETYVSGLRGWLESSFSFLFGIGLTEKGYTSMSPHNFIIQFLLDMGIIVTVLLLLVMLICIYKCKKTNYVYLLIYLLVANMAITSFFSNTFVTSCVVIVLIEMRQKSDMKRRAIWTQ